MFDHAQAVAAASDAVEAYIALAFTHLRLARVSEARQSVLAALQRAAAASHSAGEPHIWRSMCGSLMPLLAQVPDVPSAASAPLLRACSGGGESSSLQDAPGDAPLPPPPPPPPEPPVPLKAASEECSETSAEHEGCFEAAREAGPVPPAGVDDEELRGAEDEDALPAVCVCATARDGTNSLLYEWVEQQLCGGVGHVFLRDDRQLSATEAAVSRWMLEPSLRAARLTLLPPAPHVPDGASSAGEEREGARWARLSGAPGDGASWALLAPTGTPSAVPRRRPPDMHLRRQCLEAAAAQVGWPPARKCALTPGDVRQAHARLRRCLPSFLR